jgi:DNA-binding PadR family transcriptional regulator
VRAAVLSLLAEQQRHGYEIIGEIAERSGGGWRPSPGSIYPTLQALADEGLVASEDRPEGGGQRRFWLTEPGKEAAAGLPDAAPWEAFAEDAEPAEARLRDAYRKLASAAVQVSQVAEPEQKERAAEVLDTARKSLYGILGEDAAAGEAQ